MKAAKKKRRKTNDELNASIEEAAGTRLQELSRAVEDRTLRTSLTRRTARSQGHCNGMRHTHMASHMKSDEFNEFNIQN